MGDLAHQIDIQIIINTKFGYFTCLIYLCRKMKKLNSGFIKLLFKKKKDMAQQEVQTTEKHHIAEGVKNYLLMNTSGALLVTGYWGCGKTHYFKNEFFKEIMKDGSFIPVMVSLFGLIELKEIPERILYAYLDKVGKNAPYGRIAQFTKNIADALPVIKDYVDVDKLLGSGEGLYKIIPNNILICFDDIERAIETIKIDHIFGMINELVENKRYKVIIIANESFIQREELRFKEKVIEKTLNFMPDIVSIFRLLVYSRKDSQFSDFMLQESIITSINPYDNSVKGFIDSGLQKNLSNIRILKFAIEHFYPVFVHYLPEVEKGGQIDETTIKKLKNYWVFILAVSIEYKINNLSFEDNHNIDSYQATANFEIDLEDKPISFKNEEKDEEQEKIKKKSQADSKYTQHFLKKYFSRLSETLIFHAELYNYITAGIAIDYSVLNDYANHKFSIVDNVINPAYELLEQFLRGYWKFTNEQIVAKLQELLNYAQKGCFDDYMAYINATTYLVNFREMFDQSERDIITKVKEGIDKFTDRVEINYMTKIDIQMAEGQLYPNVIPVYKFALESIDRKLDNDFKKESGDIKSLFQTDLEQLVSKIIPQDISTTPKYFNVPILKNIDAEIIENKINTIEPNDAMYLRTLIEQRYIQIQPTINLQEEKPFLICLKESIAKIDFQKKTMSNFIIHEFLIPILDKAIARLDSISKENVS